MSGSYDLRNKVVLVTGASQGLGRQFAEILSANGARVALAARQVSKITSLKEELENKGGKACAVEMDVLDQQSIGNCVDIVERDLGPIDVLVNNAGVAINKFFLDVTEEEYDSVLGTNLKGCFFDRPNSKIEDFRQAKKHHNFNLGIKFTPDFLGELSKILITM